MPEEKTWEERITEKINEIKSVIGEIEKGLYNLRKVDIVNFGGYKISLDETEKNEIKAKCIALKFDLDSKVIDLKDILK